jgi:hypothetical protein
MTPATATEAPPRRFKTIDEMTDREERTYRRQLDDPRSLVDVTPYATDAWRAWAQDQRDILEQRRQAAEREVADAQRALGVAVVDQGNGSPAGKRLDAARRELESLVEAHSELQRRHADEAREHAEAEVRASRTRAYRWFAGYFTVSERVIVARAELTEAEAAVKAIGRSSRVWVAQQRLVDGESDLDEQLVGASSQAPAVPPRLTAERCRELREKAERLAALEEAA